MRRRPALIAGRVVSAGQWFAVLRATAMLIIDELSFTGNLLDALRYFVDQPRYDPWAGTLWHEYCDDCHPTAVTNRVLNHPKIRTVDPALLKPLALCESGAPHHLHPAETAEGLDLPEAALLLAGEGTRPWQTTSAVRASLKRVRAQQLIFSSVRHHPRGFRIL